MTSSQQHITKFFGNTQHRPQNRNNTTTKNNKNVQIWKNTQHLFTKGRFKKIKPPLSQGYSHEWIPALLSIPPPFEHDTVIRVWNQDTLVAAKLMHDEGLQPLILNMACVYKPGGGVRKGASAQEECLFRQTNYFCTLDKEQLPDNLYPLYKSACVYSHQVYVIKDASGNVLNDNDMFYCDFIAVAAIRHPKTITSSPADNIEEFKYDSDRIDTYNRIERIYQVAIHTKHTSLLLGAVGCGAYKNPPHEILNIFRELNQKYNKYFENITFAVLSHPGNPNYDIFKELQE